MREDGAGMMGAMTDTAFSVHPTPIGDALIVVSGAGLVALHILDSAGAGTAGDSRTVGVLTDLALALRSSPVLDAGATASVAAELDAYFAGDLRRFTSAIDWSLAGGGFAAAALQAVVRIPYGETASYGEIAAAAGSARAHRAVGSACARTPVSIVIPAHRVVRSDGSLGEYGGHPERKRFLLELEGAPAPVRV